jgi:hypothetical protein
MFQDQAQSKSKDDSQHHANEKHQQEDPDSMKKGKEGWDSRVKVSQCLKHDDSDRVVQE